MKTQRMIAMFLAVFMMAAAANAQVESYYLSSEELAQLDSDGSIDLTSSFAEANEAAACDCEQGSCSCEAMTALNKKVGKAFKTLFYDNNFNYLCDPCYDDHYLGDSLKRMCVGCDGSLDIGGQFRLRYHHEEGMKGTRFSDNQDDFLLGRMRLYANYEMNDILRFYVEGIYADSYGESLGVRGIDVNNGDFLNAFVDANVTSEMTFRVGRQELLYGAQRTVSPLDWANTRRTFEGAKLMVNSGDWSVDGFFTHLVPVDPYELDEADYDQPFYGAYATYHGLCDATLGLYYLGYDNQASAFSLHTFGAHLKGNRGDWLYEIEGAYQGGDAAGIGTGDQSDGFVTAGLGRKLSNRCWQPTVWFYLDYASEDYNQLFPLAHKYLGFIDAVQRRNVIAPNVLLTVQPTEKLKLLAWFYHFESATGSPMASIGGTPPQFADTHHFGDEIDLTANYKINARNDVLLGYSHFWKGSKINNTNDADFVYAQWMMNF